MAIFMVFTEKLKNSLKFFESFSIQNKRIFFHFQTPRFFNKFALAYVQEKYDATSVPKHKFLVEHIQYLSFRYNEVHW